MLTRLARLLVMVGQLALLLAVGTEGNHGPSAMSHVERSGIDQHYAHNEATCVSCTVLSMHARGERPSTLLPVVAVYSDDTPQRTPAAVISAQGASDHLSRAPPHVG